MFDWLKKGASAPEPRKGMPSPRLGEDEFKTRFRSQYQDPAFAGLQAELDKIAAAAWDAYSHSRKSPRTVKAGAEFADPDYDLAVDWIAARNAIHEAERRHEEIAQRIASVELERGVDDLGGGARSKRERCVGHREASGGVDQERRRGRSPEDAGRCAGADAWTSGMSSGDDFLALTSSPERVQSPNWGQTPFSSFERMLGQQEQRLLRR